MRHTFAPWAIAAGLLPTFEIAATMGTSLEQLSKRRTRTLLPDSADRARGRLDMYLSEAADASGER